MITLNGRGCRGNAESVLTLFALLLVASQVAGAPGSRKLLQSVAQPGGPCGPTAGAYCPNSQCCSQYGFCGVTEAHCMAGCQTDYGQCEGATGEDTSSPEDPPPGPLQDPPAADDSDSAAGVTKAQFTKVFAGDTDKCGPECPGYSADPNTPEVIDKHWGFFKSAAAARGFSLQNDDEASIFFGNIKHEYGGNLEQMKEFCGRKSGTCPEYGELYGRGPLQLTWENNYAAMGSLIGEDLLGNPDLVADNGRDIGWQTAMGFWTGSDFNCQGSWAGDGAPACPAAAAAGNMAAVTSRINPLECNGGRFADKQAARIQAVQDVRQSWGLGPLTGTSC